MPEALSTNRERKAAEFCRKPQCESTPLQILLPKVSSTGRGML
jgi:hypothetical protein